MILPFLEQNTCSIFHKENIRSIEADIDVSRETLPVALDGWFRSTVAIFSGASVLSKRVLQRSLLCRCRMACTH